MTVTYIWKFWAIVKKVTAEDSTFLIGVDNYGSLDAAIKAFHEHGKRCGWVSAGINKVEFIGPMSNLDNEER